MKILKNICLSLLMMIFGFQISFAQNVRKESKTSLKQVKKVNLTNIKNYPKVIALKSKRSFEEVLLDWQKTSNNAIYKRLVTENIKHRLQLLEQKSNTIYSEKVNKLNNLIKSKNYIDDEKLAVTVLIDIANLEEYYLGKKLISEKELLNYNSIIPTDISKSSFSIQGVDGKINWVNSSLYEKDGVGYYKEGSEPGSGLSRNTNISVTNNGTVTPDYFVKVSDANIPDGWDMFWWKILPHQSPTFTLDPGQTLELVNYGYQSGTQSPSYETGDAWVYYDLYQDANWPIPNLWLSGINKRNKNDVTTPTSSVNPLAPTQTSTSFNVSWNVNDPGIGSSGIDFYEITYKVNSSGTWRRWQSNPSYRSANFIGEEGNTYYFSSAALDNVGHSEPSPSGNGKTQTYILRHFVVTTSSNPPNGGTTTGDGNYTENSTVTVTANANSGYTFTNWTEGGIVVSSSSSFQFNIQSNRTLFANFTAIPPTQYSVILSSNPTNGGTTSGGGTYNAGESVTVTATANSGYTFTNWTEGGNVVSSSSSYSFTIQNDRTLVANFITGGWTEDFESYATGSFPSNWFPDGNATDNSTNFVTTAVSYEGAKSLQIHGSVGGCWAALTYHPLMVSSPFEIELAIRNGDESLSGCNPDRAKFGLRQGTSWTNPSRTFIQFKSDGTIVSGGGGVSLGTYSTLTWYTIRVRYERPSSTTVKLSYWVNGIYKGEETLAAISEEDQLTNLELSVLEGTAWFDNIVGIVTSVEYMAQIPLGFNLSQNYPNPFNPTTYIEFSLTEESYTTLTVYNISGEEVKSLLNNESLPTGIYRLNFDASDLSSGIYFYRLQAGSFVETKKMILLK